VVTNRVASTDSSPEKGPGDCSVYGAEEKETGYWVVEAVTAPSAARQLWVLPDCVQQSAKFALKSGTVSLPPSLTPPEAAAFVPNKREPWKSAVLAHDAVPSSAPVMVALMSGETVTVMGRVVDIKGVLCVHVLESCATAHPEVHVVEQLPVLPLPAGMEVEPVPTARLKLAEDAPVTETCALRKKLLLLGFVGVAVPPVKNDACWQSTQPPVTAPVPVGS
jgi:hypothetical protein